MCIITQVEAEISLAWAAQNPDKFLDYVANFRDTYQDWGLKIDYSRPNFLTLAAKRNPEGPFDGASLSERGRLMQIRFLLGALVEDADIGLEREEIIAKALDMANGSGG